MRKQTTHMMGCERVIEGGDFEDAQEAFYVNFSLMFQVLVF